jgi:hypothetical protein
MKFRKKPVIVEAEQFLPNDESIDKVMLLASRGSRKVTVNKHPNGNVEMFIETLEGTMEASIGDWIICGVSKEIYPCKPDIFDKTYERVPE